MEYSESDVSPQIKIIDKMYLGCGAHWKVSRLTLKNEIFINNRFYNQVIIKESTINNSGTECKNIEVYKIVTKANLPSLSFCSKYQYNQSACLIGEDLNTDSIIYVSPNTLKTQSSTIFEILNSLNKLRSNVNTLGSAIKPPLYESKCQENKIGKIDNFSQFMDDLKRDMIKATQHGLGMCEDAFFFGINRENEKIKISYKIVYFDTILTNCFDSQDEVIKKIKL